MVEEGSKNDKYNLFIYHAIQNVIKKDYKYPVKRTIQKVLSFYNPFYSESKQYFPIDTIYNPKKCIEERIAQNIPLLLFVEWDTFPPEFDWIRIDDYASTLDPNKELTKFCSNCLINDNIFIQPPIHTVPQEYFKPEKVISIEQSNGVEMVDILYQGSSSYRIVSRSKQSLESNHYILLLKRFMLSYYTFESVPLKNIQLDDTLKEKIGLSPIKQKLYTDVLKCCIEKKPLHIHVNPTQPIKILMVELLTLLHIKGYRRTHIIYTYEKNVIEYTRCIEHFFPFALVTVVRSTQLSQRNELEIYKEDKSIYPTIIISTVWNKSLMKTYNMGFFIVDCLLKKERTKVVNFNNFDGVISISEKYEQFNISGTSFNWLNINISNYKSMERMCEIFVTLDDNQLQLLDKLRSCSFKKPDHFISEEKKIILTPYRSFLDESNQNGNLINTLFMLLRKYFTPFLMVLSGKKDFYLIDWWYTYSSVNKIIQDFNASPSGVLLLNSMCEVSIDLSHADIVVNLYHRYIGNEQEYFRCKYNIGNITPTIICNVYAMKSIDEICWNSKKKYGSLDSYFLADQFIKKKFFTEQLQNIQTSTTSQFIDCLCSGTFNGNAVVLNDIPVINYFPVEQTQPLKTTIPLKQQNSLTNSITKKIESKPKHSDTNSQSKSINTTSNKHDIDDSNHKNLSSLLLKYCNKQLKTSKPQEIAQEIKQYLLLYGGDTSLWNLKPDSLKSINLTHVQKKIITPLLKSLKDTSFTEEVKQIFFVTSIQLLINEFTQTQHLKLEYMPQYTFDKNTIKGLDIRLFYLISKHGYGMYDLFLNDTVLKYVLSVELGVVSQQDQIQFLDARIQKLLTSV
ncbi:hypothetical protein QTN25_007944 [Entamoeba marina]